MAEATLVPAYVMPLRDALALQYGSDATIAIEHIMSDRYRFVVVASAFRGMDHADRQTQVWSLAQSVLKQSDLVKVSMILTVADDELYEDSSHTTDSDEGV